MDLIDPLFYLLLIFFISILNRGTPSDPKGGRGREGNNIPPPGMERKLKKKRRLGMLNNLKSFAYMK